ncbi:MAG: Lrp/AsnC ligand binding domain-containing protein [Candidatus Heimdallarchaeaceae archaeon]
MSVPASHREFSKVRRKSTFYILAVGSGLITSLWVILDAIGNSHITDPYLFGSFEMVVGLAVSIILIAFLHIPLPSKDPAFKKTLGYYFDPNFQGLMIPRGKVLLYTCLAGLFASGNTIIYFILLEKYDASTIMPFSQFVLVYLLLADAISEREKPVAIEIQSIVMIAFGVIISTVSGGSLDFIGILLIFGPFSICSAAYVYFQKKTLTYKTANHRTMDTLSLRIWTLLIMTAGQILSALPSIIKNGLDEVLNNWKPALAPVICSMLLVYIGVVFYTRALTMGKMSIVRSLNSISVIATIPLASLFSIWFPNIFSSEFTDPVGNILKVSGSILILTGMITLALSETRGILLAKLKMGERIDLDKLSKIKGIESVAYVSGIYDLIIFIKMRNIGKAYNLIRKSIAKLPWIESVITLPLMREYS